MDSRFSYMMNNMKKKFFVLGAIVLLLALSATGVFAKHHFSKEENDFFDTAKKIKNDKTVVAIVDNEKIYKYQIDFIKASQRLSQKNAELSGIDASEITVQSDEEILQQLIRNTVIVQEAKRQKKEAKYNDAKKYIKTNYDKIMADNDSNSEFLRKYMSELGLSENEYIKLASQGYQDTMTRENFYNDFAHKNSETTENIQELYEQYVLQLLDGADVQYK